MINRRLFLQSTAASVAVTSSAAAFTPFPMAGAHVQGFVFDDRYPQSVAIARSVGRHGVPLFRTSGSLTTLWYEHLQPAWMKSPSVLAGATQGDALFMLEALAADFRMRVVVRGEHTLAHDGGIAHQLRGPRQLVANIKGMLAPETWCESLGAALTQCSFDEASVGSAGWQSLATQTGEGHATLYSWVLVPRGFAATRV